MRKLNDIAISIKIPIDYSVGAAARIYGGKWIPLTVGEEIMRARESAMSWIEQHLPRPDAKLATVIVEPCFVCGHCGSGWTESDSLYNGGCCDEDEKNNPELRASADLAQRQASKACKEAPDAK